MKATTALVAGIALLIGAGPAMAGTCDREFDHTFDLIQSAIFEERGCASATCHDAVSAAGGLVLTGEGVYDNLIDAAVQSIPGRPGLQRVTPAKKEDSLLWLNLAAATLPEQWRAPLRPMPQGGLPPLTLDELRAIQLWIEGGAPRTGVVPETGDLLDACLPRPEPNETKPLDPPAPGTGLQLRAPRQILAPQIEREVCFVTYYDVTDQVPPQFRSPGGDSFRYKRISARQDPLSHHAVVIPYRGATPIHSAIWGAFTCGGGERDGEPCEPTDLSSCGAGGVCGSQPMPAVGCIGYGPGDASIGVGNDSLFNTMAAGLGSIEGIYAEAPLRGILVWNSHAFNVTGSSGKLDIWVNLEFAAPEEQRHALQRFTDISATFGINVPPFEAQDLCARYIVPPNASIIELSSHNHRRGRRFRIWEGAFGCAGGPNPGTPCSPLEADPDLGLVDPCAGTACVAAKPMRGGDCNGDRRVTIDELTLGVGIALGITPVDDCAALDRNTDLRVSVDEVLLAVDLAISPNRDPQESLLYTSLTYADPVVTKFDPPLKLGDARSTDAERTLTFCSLYDNGKSDGAEVKRRSTSPRATNGFPGGPCPTAVACTAGLVGAPCNGSDAQCDSAPGDGECDACPIYFGTTTEDEMFILLGAFFIE